MKSGTPEKYNYTICIIENWYVQQRFTTEVDAIKFDNTCTPFETV